MGIFALVAIWLLASSATTWAQLPLPKVYRVDLTIDPSMVQRFLALSMDADGYIWFGNATKTLFCYDPRSGAVEAIPMPSSRFWPTTRRRRASVTSSHCTNRTNTHKAPICWRARTVNYIFSVRTSTIPRQVCWSVSTTEKLWHSKRVPFVKKRNRSDGLIVNVWQASGTRAREPGIRERTR